jgi:GT2 family glycosyltransferase/tetratricopeptide (TPR) repeat protein
MRRPPATVVVPAWNAWEQTQACLESLRPTLGVQDQVVVVDNGSTDATAARLKLFSWAEVVTNDSNLGVAEAYNVGAGLAQHELIVFLHNDTVLTGHWLDALLAPFDDAAVGAVGPRSNFCSGPQAADGASYLDGDTAALRQFAREWERAHRGAVSTAESLGAFCLAVRRAALDEVLGFDEDTLVSGIEEDDLCRRLTAKGWQLRLADGSFVHHAGHRTYVANGVDWFARRDVNRSRFEERWGAAVPKAFPLISACLIVKDEEDNLPSCLASLEGLADEVVVYDTGSTDGTVAVAEQFGAIVLEGYWDDDFSRARNEALAACTGDWIAWLDADETLRCPDVPALRASLARTGPEVDGFSVVIENTTGAGVGSMFVHSACRFFRRSRCEWAGRLHEQVAGRGTHRPVATTALAETVRIHHTGYTSEAMSSRGKAERNLRVAEAEVQRSEGWDKGFSLTSLGRSYMTAGQPEEALDYCRRGAESTTNMITRRLAYRTIVDALVALGRFDDALEALDDLRQSSDKTVLVQVLEANIARQQGRHEEALALFEVVDQSQFDDDGFEYDATMFAQQRAESLSALGRSGEAADALLSVLADRGVLDSHLGIVVEYLDRAGRSLEDLALALPSDQLPQFLAQVLQLREDAADRVLEACLEHRPADTLAVLATAATLARRLPLERALQWSDRLRACGLDSSCPLVFLATDGQRSTVERARAVAAGFKLFGDPRLPPCLADILRAATDDERATISAEAAVLCPALLEEPGLALSGDPR